MKNQNTVNNCILQELAKRYNLSLTAAPYNFNTSIGLTSYWYDEGTIDGIFNDIRYIYKEMDKEAFTFLVIIPRPTGLKGFKALIEPLDLTTWLCLSLIFGLITLIISLDEGTIAIKIDYLWTVYSVLLYQGNNRISALSRNCHNFAWVVSFILPIMVLGCLYQGELATSVTTVVTPVTPTTLQDLANSNLIVMTSGWAVDGDDFYSNLFFNANQTVSKFDQDLEIVTKLRKIMKRVFLVKEFLELINNFTSGDEVNGFPVKSELQWGDSVAFMDVSWRVREIAKLVDDTKTHVTIVGREESPLFDKRVWIISRNFFVQDFLTGVKRLEQGGLVAVWQDRKDLLMDKERYLDWYQDDESKGHIFRKTLVQRWFNRKKNVFGFLDSSKVTQESLNYCYLFCLCLLCGALIIFVGEILTVVKSKIVVDCGHQGCGVLIQLRTVYD